MRVADISLSSVRCALQNTETTLLYFTGSISGVFARRSDVVHTLLSCHVHRAERPSLSEVALILMRRTTIRLHLCPFNTYSV